MGIAWHDGGAETENCWIHSVRDVVEKNFILKMQLVTNSLRHNEILLLHIKSSGLFRKLSSRQISESSRK